MPAPLKERARQNMTRTALTLGLVAMAIAVSGCAASYPSEIDVIAGNDSLNQLTADSAPQQAVVNGWTARDYLELGSRQGTEQSVLLYVVVALLIIVALQLVGQNRRLSRLVQLSAAAGAAPEYQPNPEVGRVRTPGIVES